jgi:hypothetical protein
LNRDRYQPKINDSNAICFNRRIWLVSILSKILNLQVGAKVFSWKDPPSWKRDNMLIECCRSLLPAMLVKIYMYRDVQKVFGHCNFLLYISYKTTIFQNIILKSILVRFWWYFYQQKWERTFEIVEQVIRYNLVWVCLRLINREAVYEKRKLAQTRLCKYNLFNII